MLKNDGQECVLWGSNDQHDHTETESKSNYFDEKTKEKLLELIGLNYSNLGILRYFRDSDEYKTLKIEQIMVLLILIL